MNISSFSAVNFFLLFRSVGLHKKIAYNKQGRTKLNDVSQSGDKAGCHV